MVDEQTSKNSWSTSWDKKMNLLTSAPTGHLKKFVVAINLSGATLIGYCGWAIILALDAQESSRRYEGSSTPTWMVDYDAKLWKEDYRQFVSLANFFGIYLLFVVGIIFWTYNAHTYIQPLSEGKRKWGKGWAIGGWFTPVGFLFIPFLVNRETENIVNNGKKSNSLLGPIWFYSVWVAIVSRNLANQETEYEAFFNWHIFTYVALIFAVATAVLYFAEVSCAIHERTIEIESAKSRIETVVSTAPPSAITGNATTAAEQLRTLGQLLSEGLISEDEFNAKKTEILKFFG
jgi:hypothetical protein